MKDLGLKISLVCIAALIALIAYGFGLKTAKEPSIIKRDSHLKVEHYEGQKLIYLHNGEWAKVYSVKY